MTWGRGFYDSRAGGGGAVDQVLAEMAEKARLREQQQRQAELQQQQMQHERTLNDRRIMAEVAAAYIRNPNENTYAAMQASGLMGGAQMPAPQLSPEELYRRNIATDAIGAWDKDPVFRGLAPGGLEAGRYQLGFGAAAPNPVVTAGVQRAVYSNPNAIPAPQMQAQRVADALDLNADQQEKKVQWGQEFSRIKLPESRATVAKLNAEAAKDRAATASTTSPTITPGTGAPLLGPSGDEYLAMLPPDKRNLIKKIANYEMDISKVTSLRGGEREKVAQMVAQYDPTFDMTQYQARAAARKDLTSGMTYRNLTRLNQVVHHLKDMEAAGERLDNTRLPAVNWLKNTAKTQTGSPDPVRFETAKNAVVTEMAAIYKGTAAPTEQEITEWGKTINVNMSPPQRKAAIDTMIQLMRGRLIALNDQYRTVMGKPRDFAIIQPESRKILKDFGHNIDDIEPSGGGGGGIRNTPDGGTAPKVGDTKTAKNGKLLYYDGSGWTDPPDYWDK